MNSGTFILGLLNGLTTGLLAIGIVLVYRSSRFLNMAHAQMGALSSQLLAKLVIDAGWSFWAAAVLCVPIGIGTALLADRWIVRPLRERSASGVQLLLVTIGLSEILDGITSLGSLGPNTTKITAQGYPQPFHASVRVGGVTLNGSDISIMIVVPLIVTALALFLRFTLLGKTIRAAATNQDEARLCGISTRRVSAVTWALAGGMAAVSAILEGPRQSSVLASALGPQLLLYALGAAALAAFVSIPLAMLGGILIGLADQLTLAQTSNGSTSEVVVFGVIIAIVLVRGRAIGDVFAASGGAFEDPRPIRVPASVRDLPTVRYAKPMAILAALTITALAPLLPFLSSESSRFKLTIAVVYSLVAISLTIAIGWAGQISLGHFALVGAGAFVGAHMLGHGWSIVSAIVVVGMLGGLLTIIVGLPAVRVPGLTLAVSTLGLGIVGPDWLFHQDWFGTHSFFGVLIDPPNLGRGLGRPSGELVVFYLGAALVFAVGLAMVALRRAQAGRIVVAVRDNEAAAAAFGLTPATVKMAALALSGFVAAIGGVIWADAWRNVTAAQFPPQLSFTMLSLPVLGGMGSIAGAAVSATIFALATFFLAPHMTSLFGPIGSSVGFQLFVAGFGLVLGILYGPQGLAGAMREVWQRRLNRLAGQIPATQPPPGPATLVARDIDLHFGGIAALQQASIEVRPGEIVGLIGPNGAGKTTLLNVISGRLKSDGGTVHLGEAELTGLPPELRAAFGVSRSFQDARLFPGLTVTETIQVAMATHYKSTMVGAATGAPWVRMAERDNRRSAVEILERLGLTPWADALTADLSTGTRRICDLAAQVATRPRILLLDEPTAGVAQREAEAFAPLLRRIREELDCSILIVEHDMPMLMGLCDRVYALVAGSVIATGTPEEVRSNPEVIASYLGTDEVAVTRSGERRTVEFPLPAGDTDSPESTRPTSNGARKTPTPVRKRPTTSGGTT